MGTSREHPGNIVGVAQARAAAIRAARLERDWSIARAARELIEISVEALPDQESVIVAWKRWERGVTPTARYRGLLSVLLGIDRDVLAGRRYPGAVDRRDFLATTSIGFAGLAGDLPGIAFLDGHRRIDADDVARLRARRDQLGLLADQEGAGVYEIAVSFTRRLGQYARRCEYSEQVGHALQDLSTQMARLCSWLAWDAGLERQAGDWGRTAVDTARSPEHAAVAVAVLARQALDAIRPADALDLLDGQRSKDPTVRSAVAARRALAYAQLGDQRSAIQELGRARRYADRQGLQSLTGVSPATVVFHEAEVAEQLGEYQTADTAARNAVLALGHDKQRNRALYLLRLACILIESGELDEARATVERAADIEIASPLVASQLGAVRRRLATAAA